MCPLGRVAGFMANTSWRIHGGVEDTKFSTNKQHSLSHVCVYDRPHAWEAGNSLSCKPARASAYKAGRVYVILIDYTSKFHEHQVSMCTEEARRQVIVCVCVCVCVRVCVCVCLCVRGDRGGITCKTAKTLSSPCIRMATQQILFTCSKYCMCNLV